MRIALIQMTIETGRRSANLMGALDWIDKACEADPSPDVVVLPAYCDIGWPAAEAAELAEPVGGAFAESLAAKAREMGVHVVAGLTERDGAALYSVAVLFDVDGDVLLRHRKINVPQPERDLYAPGDRLSARRTTWGTVGLQVATDLSAGCLTEALAAMEARVIFAPCAWACRPGRDGPGIQAVAECLAERTTAAPVYLVSANGVGQIDDGTQEPKVLFGGSMVYGPGGQALLVGPENEQALLTVEVPTNADATAEQRTSRGR